MKQSLLIGVSAIVLLISGAASAQVADSQGMNINHAVVGNNPLLQQDLTDNGSTRRNSLNGGTLNGATGVGHAMQNNGSNNAISSADIVALNPTGTTVQTGSITATVTDNATQDSGRKRTNDVNGSYGSVQGMFNVQQNNGDNNSMAAGNQVLVRTNGTPLNLDTSTTQSVAGSNFADSVGGNRQNTIQGSSFSGARGILNIQQNNGDNNALAQKNIVAVGIGTTSMNQKITSTGSVGTNPPSFGSTAYDTGVTRTNTLTGALQGVQGIVSVQQNNGNNNVMASTNAVGVSIGALGSAVQSADLNATVGNAYAAQLGITGSTMTNNATGVMTNARGIMTMQQNNGNNNVIQSAVMVSANVTRP